MNASTFGTDAKFQESLARHNAKYGTDDPAEQGRMIAEAQRTVRASREQDYRAPVAPGVRPSTVRMPRPV